MVYIVKSSGLATKLNLRRATDKQKVKFLLKIKTNLLEEAVCPLLLTLQPVSVDRFARPVTMLLDIAMFSMRNLTVIHCAVY